MAQRFKAPRKPKLGSARASSGAFSFLPERVTLAGPAAGGGLGGKVAAAIQGHIDRQIMATVMLLQANAGRIESAMKANAPWKDRTTNARNGLTATVRIERGPGWVRLIVDMGHSMEYGVMLEKAHGGRYAIVDPTADHEKPELTRQVMALLK